MATTKRRSGGKQRRPAFVLTGPVFLRAIRYAGACRLGRAEARERIAMRKGDVMAAICDAITDVLVHWPDGVRRGDIPAAQPGTAAYVRWLANAVHAEVLSEEERRTLNEVQPLLVYARRVLTERNVRRWVERRIDQHERARA